MNKIAWSVIISLMALMSGIWSADERWNQKDDVRDVSDAVRLQTITMHQYHFDDLALRVIYLESKPDRSDSDERELLLYEARKEKIILMLESLGEL